MGEAKRQGQRRGFSTAGNVTNMQPVRPQACEGEANAANEEAVGSEDELADEYVTDGIGEALEHGSNAGETITSESDIEEAVAPRGLAKITLPLQRNLNDIAVYTFHTEIGVRYVCKQRGRTQDTSGARREEESRHSA